MHITFDFNSIMILIGIIISLIFFFITQYRVRKTQDQLNRMMNVLYQIHRNYDTSHQSLQEIEGYTKQLHEGFSILEVAYKKVYGEKHMPSPQEAQQIESTIRDLLAIEIVLSQDMVVPRRESFNNVILAAIRTYPTINEEYLIKKTTSIFTSFIKDNQS